MTLVRYLLFSLTILLIQATLVPLFSVRAIQPDLVTMVVVWVALREGRFWGTMVGFFLGLGMDATTTQFFGLSALTKGIAGYVAASIRIELAELGFRRWIQVVAVAALTDRLLYYTIFSLGSDVSIPQSWLRFSIPATAYTLAVAAIVAAVWPKEFLGSRTAKL
jgi:rod shape-determining protein MreD